MYVVAFIILQVHVSRECEMAQMTFYFLATSGLLNDIFPPCHNDPKYACNVYVIDVTFQLS